jgi:hypothetical protein
MATGIESRELQLRAAEMPDKIPPQQWDVYSRVMGEARRRGIRFAIGGGFAVSTYTGRWRNTKDLDLYVHPEQRQAMITLVSEAGLTDYFEQLGYDRNWIYRAHVDDTIVDVMWAMANYRAQVDDSWFTHARTIWLRGEPVQLLALEDMIWDKMYVLQRDRCDWPDVLNLLYAGCAETDWDYLFERVGPDLPLLSGVMALFAWLCPAPAQALPRWIWSRLRLLPPPQGSAPDLDRQHADLLDKRPWLGLGAGCPPGNGRC